MIADLKKLLDVTVSLIRDRRTSRLFTQSQAIHPKPCIFNAGPLQNPKS